MKYIVIKYLVRSGYNWQVCEQADSHYEAIIGACFKNKEAAELWINLRENEEIGING